MVLGEALCRGSGPRIRGMQKRVPKNSFFLFCRRRRPVKGNGEQASSMLKKKVPEWENKFSKTDGSIL
jgi:hypothetical protein